MSRDLSRILITLGDDLAHSHPFRVLLQTSDEVLAKPGSVMRSRIRDAVQCRSQRAALSYANGVNHGRSTADAKSLPIVWDVILRPADGGGDSTVYVRPELVREGGAA